MEERESEDQALGGAYRERERERELWRFAVAYEMVRGGWVVYIAEVQ